MTPGAQHIYLDHNATTHLLPQAAEAIERVHQRAWEILPASIGPDARRGNSSKTLAMRVAALLGARCDTIRGDRVIFTSGGTESNNLAVLGLAGPDPAHAIVSAIEHPSLAGPADELRRRGWTVDVLPVSPTGVADVDALADLVRPDTRLVSLMLANNETGVIQPVARAAEICAMRGVPLHTDAAQAAGKLAIDFAGLGVAALSLSADKFGGPPGLGLLLVRHDAALRPLHHGGFQQSGLRPGTEPVALVAGMHAALAYWQRKRAALTAHLAHSR